jgi:hypothetical protein
MVGNLAGRPLLRASAGDLLSIVMAATRQSTTRAYWGEDKGGRVSDK